MTQAPKRFFVLPTLLKDGYKVGHIVQYPTGTTMISSNFTPRGSRIPNSPGLIAFAFQFFVQRFLIEDFNQNFFGLKRDDVIRLYKRRIDNYLGPGVSTTHIGELHELGYLPLLIKALPEGTLTPYRVPVLTIRNTVDQFYWLTNMLETLLSAELWLPMTSATTAFMYRREFEKWAALTGAPADFIKWQGHDFSMRGMGSVDDAMKSGAAHLLSFTGTDTIPAIDWLERYYGADCEKELIGGSVPATEHSVMCMGEKDHELETIRRLITEVYPRGIVSIVWDTWDFWRATTEFLRELRPVIMSRDGKVVIRPDSGDPVKIICGDPDAPTDSPEFMGAIEVLWGIFGGTVTEKGYRQLHPHIGLIYGDSITLARQTEILSRLEQKGFAFTGVLGIGSYTYQYVTRDTHGFAMKATYGEVDRCPREIWKDPATDDGLKKSAKGLVMVDRDLKLVDQCTWAQENAGLLQTIFRDGGAQNIQTLAQIRARIEAQL